MAAGGFVSRAFEAMLKECSGKKYPDLQKAIQTYLDAAKEVNQPPTLNETSQAASFDGEGSSLELEDGAAKAGTHLDHSQTVLQISEEAQRVGKPVGFGRKIATALANAGYTLEAADAELVLNPLRLAFETRNLKILDLALDCLHKLIAYDHLEGDPGLDGSNSVPLFTDILNMVCSCVDNLSPDSTILQVLKVLLTAVASTKFRVHGEPLLGIIRICYNIALHSKSPINQATSKAMLTQMISIIFRRMETDHVSPLSNSSQKMEAASADKPDEKVEETPNTVQNEEAISLEDVRGTSIASVEELHNLAGGADIKVYTVYTIMGFLARLQLQLPLRKRKK